MPDAVLEPHMISISEAAKLIVTEPAPLVLLDTCALLDILRAPQRDEDPDIAIRAAVEVVARVSAPRRIWAVGAGIIKIEWADNATTVSRSLQQHIRQLDHSVRRLKAAAQALPPTVLASKGAGQSLPAPGLRAGFEALNIGEQLNSVVEKLLGSAVWLDTPMF
jgi:hypothetical protein